MDLSPQAKAGASMFPMSKRWMMVAAVGQGVLFSLALVGAVRIGCLNFGITLSEAFANQLFVSSSAAAGSLCAWSCARYLRHSAKARDEQPMSVLRRPLL
jgi:hypothetical protein